MEVVFIVVNKGQYVKRILKEIKKMGILGITIMDTMGAGQFIGLNNDEAPMIGGMRGSDEDIVYYNKTIVVAANGEHTAEDVMDAVEIAIGGSMAYKKAGIMFSIPILKEKGLHRERGS